MSNDMINLIQNNIKKYRLYKGLTQEQLSEMCNISNDYLSEIERGKKTPSLKTFIIIVNKLQVPIKKFFEK